VRVLLLFFSLQFFSIGFLFEYTYMAMQPVGHIAGTAAAVTGCISTIMARYPSVFTLAALLPKRSATFVGFQYAPYVLVYLK
jgi:DHA1 family bicyclomycin/chloramphenicol resistance-like MFS transporter